MELPCNASTSKSGDEVKLVLWFKNGSNKPIYTYVIVNHLNFPAKTFGPGNCLDQIPFFAISKMAKNQFLNGKKVKTAKFAISRKKF